MENTGLQRRPLPPEKDSQSVGPGAKVPKVLIPLFLFASSSPGKNIYQRIHQPNCYGSKDVLQPDSWATEHRFLREVFEKNMGMVDIARRNRNGAV